MSTSTVSGTNIQDPTGQVFAFGVWSLYFTPAYGVAGPYNDGGVAFTRIYGGSLDNNGSFSQVGINRNDTIAPAGSLWLFQVSPNASNNTYSVLINVNSPVFDVTPAINAAIKAISVSPTLLATAYKNAEVIPPVSAGAMYYDTTAKILKVWDNGTLSWVAQISTVNFAPVSHNFLTGVNNGVFSAAQPASADISDGTGTGVVARQDSPTFTTKITTPTAVLNGVTLNATTGSGGTVVVQNSPVIVTPSITSPAISGTPSGTGIPTVTLKKGSGAGNYGSNNTTFAAVDTTNLQYTVTIPIGWKLLIQVNAATFNSTATANVSLAIVDGSVLVENQITGVLNNSQNSTLSWVINGDGASHTINLQAKTTNAADNWNIFNDTATRIPTMTFLLTPSN